MPPNSISNSVQAQPYSRISPASSGFLSSRLGRDALAVPLILGRAANHNDTGRNLSPGGYDYDGVFVTALPHQSSDLRSSSVNFSHFFWNATMSSSSSTRFNVLKPVGSIRRLPCKSTVI